MPRHEEPRFSISEGETRQICIAFARGVGEGDTLNDILPDPLNRGDKTGKLLSVIVLCVSNQIVRNWLNRTSLESISNRTGISDWLKFSIDRASLEKLQAVASSLDDELDDNMTTSVSLEASRGRVLEFPRAIAQNAAQRSIE